MGQTSLVVRGVQAQALAPAKGKEQVPVSEPTIQVGSQSPPRSAGASFASTAPREKKRRLLRSDGSTVRGAPWVGQ
jgi:hypothetical protein